MNYKDDTISSFVSGMARTLDIGNSYSKKVKSKIKAINSDSDSLKSDWNNIGNDVTTAIKTTAR